MLELWANLHYFCTPTCCLHTISTLLAFSSQVPWWRFRHWLVKIITRGILWQGGTGLDTYQICIQAHFDIRFPFWFSKYRARPLKRPPNTALRLMHVRKRNLAVPPFNYSELDGGDFFLALCGSLTNWWRIGFSPLIGEDLWPFPYQLVGKALFSTSWGGNPR